MKSRSIQEKEFDQHITQWFLGESHNKKPLIYVYLINQKIWEYYNDFIKPTKPLHYLNLSHNFLDKPRPILNQFSTWPSPYFLVMFPREFPPIN